MKKIGQFFRWIIKYLVFGIMYSFIIPIGLAGIIWSMVQYAFLAGYDLAEEQMLDNVKD